MSKHISSALKHFLTRISIVVLLLMITVTTVSASASVRSESFVYAISAFDGQIYQSSFAPASTKTIYLMENENNVLASKQTEVYYWPLTQKYDADWLAENKFVDGTLEITQGNKLVDQVSPHAYVIQYDSNDPIGTRKLSVGEDAVTAYDNFKAQRQAYQDRQAQYTKDYQAYQEEVTRIVTEAKEKGKTVANSDFPPEPEKVADFTLFSTDIANGFTFALPAGTYSIRLRLADGSIQTGSEKELVVFGKLREAISYKVIPADRWTAPDYSKEPEGVIYAPDNSTLYLVPYQEFEYNQQAYQRMLDPQEKESRADQTTWVSFNPYSQGKIVLSRPGQPAQESEIVSYYVSQNASSGLGYSIDVFDSAKATTPSFEGYKIMLDRENSQSLIYLKDANGNVLNGSERQVRVLNTTMSKSLYLTSLLPLLIGVIVILSRRASVKKIKVEG